MFIGFIFPFFFLILFKMADAAVVKFKVVDYGLRDILGPTLFHSRQLATRKLCPYLAPEMRTMEAVSLPLETLKQADMYSFGVVLAECFISQAPQLSYDQITTLDFPAMVPNFLRNIIKDCVSSTPASRPSAKTVRNLIIENLMTSYFTAGWSLDDLEGS